MSVDLARLGVDIERVPLLGASLKPPLAITRALEIALSKGFRGAGACTMVAIGFAESGLVPNARYYNRNRATGQVLSVDRGIVQINSVAWPQITDAMADDPETAFALAFDPISKRGTTFQPWSTFNNGAYLVHLPDVQRALLKLQQPSVQHLDRPFHGPVIVTQPFGPTAFTGEPPAFVYPDGSVSYYTQGQNSRRYDHVHGGVDWSLPYGTQLYAPADGTVSYTGRDNLGSGGSDSGFGLTVRIHHQTVTTLYAHLSQVKVNTGQTVKRGDLIALSGGAKQTPDDFRPGNSTGAHLHWSCIRLSDNHYVDPALYIFAPDVPLPKPMPTPLHPGAPYHPVDFTVTVQSNVRGVTHLYAAARTDALKITDLPAGTMLRCIGWRYGAPRLDRSTGKKDRRWYLAVLTTGEVGYVASARVLGNAPGSMP